MPLKSTAPIGYSSSSLWGYYTKYDCASADLNPIGSYDKGQLHELASSVKETSLLHVINSIQEAIPSAELAEGQSDESDMGITYKELVQRGRQFVEHPSFERDSIFHEKYVMGRHKAAILPPTFHAHATNPELVHGPFFYPTNL